MRYIHCSFHREADAHVRYLGHQRLYTECGVLHRDISVGNVMRTATANRVTAIDGQVTELWGCLVDFDMAAFWFRDDDESLSDARVVSALN